MGQICDFCGEQRSIIYCRSDAASLCLSCDCNVHSANALSRRHSRTLVRERFNSQPAAIRCIEEEISLCQNCNWSSHAVPASAAGHKHQSISYSGCPSAAELSSIWSFFSADYLSCNPGIGSTSQEKEGLSLYFHSLPPMLYSITEAAMDPMASDLDKFSGKRSLNSLNEKVKLLCIYASCGCCCWLTWGIPGRTKHLKHFDGDDLYKNLNILDIELGFNDCEELFGKSFDDQQFLENGGIDSLFEIGSLHGSQINTKCAYAIKDSSASRTKADGILQSGIC